MVKSAEVVIEGRLKIILVTRAELFLLSKVYCGRWKNLICSVLCLLLTASVESQEMYFVFLVS